MSKPIAKLTSDGGTVVELCNTSSVFLPIRSLGSSLVCNTVRLRKCDGANEQLSAIYCSTPSNHEQHEQRRTVNITTTTTNIPCLHLQANGGMSKPQQFHKRELGFPRPDAAVAVTPGAGARASGSCASCGGGGQQAFPWAGAGRGSVRRGPDGAWVDEEGKRLYTEAEVRGQKQKKRLS